MKNRIVLILFSILIVVYSLAIHPISSLAIADDKIMNNAFDDYSSTDNPNGVWSYESRVFDENTDRYIYTALTNADNVWGSLDSGTAITKTTACMETNKNAIRILASNDCVTETVLSYTAPENGTVKISMKNGGVFSTTRNKTGLIRFSVLNNDNKIKAISNLGNENNVNNPFFGDVAVANVKKGDIIRFVVGKNANQGGKTYTDLDPVIEYAKIEKPKAKEYSAAAEFTDTDNQWRYYGYDKNTSQYKKLNFNSDRWGTVANCSIAVATDPISGKKAMSLHSGVTLDPTLAFVTPFTGKLKIDMNNGGIFAPQSGYDGIIFTLKLNDEIILNKKINSVNNYEGNRIFTDEIELSVIAGDIIYFCVNQNKNTRGDSTYFDPHIKYTETVGEYDPTLRFLDNDEILCTNIHKNSFDISWPSARGGVGDYEYAVYISRAPIVDIPLKDEIKIENGRSYTFTELESGTDYYIAVVASDGASQALLTNTRPISTISELFIFNGYDDFSIENMVAPWSYEFKPSGADSYKKLEWNENGFWGDKVSCGYIQSAKSDLVTGKSAILLEPYAGSTLSIKFVAPYTGTIELSLANGGIMVPYNGAANKWDGINFKLYLNDKEFLKYDSVNASNIHASDKGDMYKGRLFDDKISIDVKAGDVIRFAVDQNKAFGNDKTYINPEIIYKYVQDGSLDLHFDVEKGIIGENISDKEMTVVIPTAFGGTGNNNYTVYYSTEPIVNIPDSGGIDLGNNTFYKLTGLTSYTNYYFAAKVFDGEKTVSYISPQPISTIGNTYVFDAMGDWSTNGQPIDTPWRYCMQSINDGTLRNLNWDNQRNIFCGDSNTPSITVATDVKDPVTGNKSLKLHPDAEYNVIVLFTAPYSGNVVLDSANGGVFTPYNGAAQKYDGINFSVLLNEKTLYSKNAVCGNNNHNDRCFSNSIESYVKRGDKICFIINKNDVINADTTFFNPRVTYNFVEKGSDTFAFWPGASVSCQDATTNSLTLSWSSAFGADGAAETYSLWINKSPINSRPSTKPIYCGPLTYYKCTNLSIGSKYYVYIEAVDKFGAKSILNPNTFIKTVGPVYNAYNDFNTKNDAAIWNYAVTTKDPKTGKIAYKLMNFDDGIYGTTATGSIKTAESDLVCGKNVISMHTGSAGQAPTLVFTAPYSGEIIISMVNGGVFCPHNGAEQNFDGVAFEVLKNDDSILRFECISSKNNHIDERLFTQPITLSIKQGDKIYFVVEPNSNNAGDSTFFNPQIEYLNIIGGDGKVSVLTGFKVADEVVKGENNLTFVNYRNNDTKKATSATGYQVITEDDGGYNNQLILYVIIAFAFVIVAFAICIFLNKSRKY